MGLDMYLHAVAERTQSKYDKKATPCNYVGPFERFNDLQLDRNYRSVETNCQIGYWRKFNALHKYICDTFADGVDECQRIYLSSEDIVQILDLLKKITPENAKELLPPSTGFFFGSQEIDEWYMKEVEYSIKVFELALDFLYEEMKPMEKPGSKDGLEWEFNKDNPYPEYKYRSIYYKASW